MQIPNPLITAITDFFGALNVSIPEISESKYLKHTLKDLIVKPDPKAMATTATDSILALIHQLPLASNETKLNMLEFMHDMMTQQPDIKKIIDSATNIAELYTTNFKEEENPELDPEVIPSSISNIIHFTLFNLANETNVPRIQAAIDKLKQEKADTDDDSDGKKPKL